MESLYKKWNSVVKYPAKARINNIEGKLFVSFIVDEMGNISDYKVEKFEEIPGYGIKGFVNGHEVIIGNLALMKSYDFFYDESLDELREPVILIMIDDRYSGCFLMMEYPQ